VTDYNLISEAFMRRALSLASLTLTLLALAPTAQTQDVNVNVSVDVNGTWFRSTSEGDDPEEKIQHAVRGYMAKASQRRGARIAVAESPQLPGMVARTIDTFMQYADELYIELDADELVVDDGDGRIRIYYLDAEKHERQLSNGVRIETVATRVGLNITIDQKADDTKILETYVFSSDGERLELTVRLENKQLNEPLIIQSIYERE